MFNMGLRIPLAIPDFRDPKVLYTLFAVLCFVYILSPLVVFVTGEDIVDRVIWNIWEGSEWQYRPLWRRSFVFVVLVYLSDAFDLLSPWTVWQILHTILAPISIWLTYLFVRHFRKTGPLSLRFSPSPSPIG